jgi:hypothetical protein
MFARKSLSASASAAKLYVEDVFSTWLYTGNGSTQTITNGIDLSGKGGLVWIKNRNGTSFGNVDHCLHDSARGVTKSLASNLSSQEFDQTTGGVTAFNASGFSLGNYPRYNDNTYTYASWTFRKAAKFFDVVTYTGTGSNRTISHNLGSIPGTIIVKRTDTTGDWQVYHRSLANTEYLVLNSTAAKATGTTRWNSTTPTSTVFSLGTDATVNASGGTYVAYLLAHDAGGFGDSGSESVVKCGSYTGTSSAGNVVALGWEPQYVLIKNITGSWGWAVIDTMRDFSQTNAERLFPHSSDASDSGNFANPTATGFILNTNNLIINNSGDTYIYIAIRRGPMKTPTDATKVFDVDAQAGGSFVTTSFPVDLSLLKRRTNVETTYALSRLQGGTQYLETASTNAEQTAGASPVIRFDSNVGVEDDFFGSGSSLAYFNFRRAPGFFDVVAYTGTGSAQTVSHNLGVVPELVIIKGRSQSTNWKTYYSFTSTTYKDFNLNSTSAASNGTYGPGGFPNFESFSTAPTVTTFSVSANSTVINNSGTTYIAYLFASCLGVSKVGIYTGTGTTLNIDCGFTNGARFVLIKRTDSSGDWYVWDTARGIISGDDPYLLLNSTAAEVTNTDYIDPLSSGFQISSTAPAAINANGGTFIYLAIA